MREHYDPLITASMGENLLVYTAGIHIQERTEAMRNDQLALVEELKVNADNGLLADESGDSLQSRVLKYLKYEINVMYDLDRKNKQLHILDQIASNKMHSILSKVQEEFLTGTESALASLALGEFKPEPSFDVTWPILRTDSYWGSTRGVVGSAKLISVIFATTTKDIANYAETSIAHVTPELCLPQFFIESDSKFYMTTANNIPAFGFVHGGYAYGGQRNERVRYKFGPEDCSSMVANWLDTAKKSSDEYQAATHQFSTLHQLYAWRAKQKQPDGFMIDREVFHKDMEAHFEGLFQEAITADQAIGGDVYLRRNFNNVNGDPDHNSVGSGHTGVVIGKDPDDDSRVLIFECARDMESLNTAHEEFGAAGAGVGSFSAQYEEKYHDTRFKMDRTKRTMFLRPRLST